MYTFYCVKLQLLVKQNPVIPNINSGANIILYTLGVHKLYLLYIVYVFEKYTYETCITGLTWAENRSDMDCE